jgi:hypothetical protein
LRQLISGSGVTMPATIVYDVWINSTNLPIRVAFTENVTRAGTATKVTVDMTYTQWGAPVRIQAPPADQIGPLPTH